MTTQDLQQRFGNSIEKTGLSETALDLLQNARSKNTRKAYACDWNQFSCWSVDHGFESLPAAESTLVEYLVHLHRLGQSAATLARKLSALSLAHQARGFRNPAGALVREIMRGIRRSGAAQRKADPLLAADLQRVCDRILPDVLGKRDKAILLLGWSAALRRSEISALDLEDLSFSDAGVQVALWRTKTDQEGKGQTVGVPAIDSPYCPIRALKQWLEIARIDAGPLFRPVGISGADRFFSIVKNKRLSDRSICLVVQRRTRQAKLKGYFAGHSLRAGWTTSAAAIGVSSHQLMQHTRHLNERIMRGYIRSAELFDVNPLALMLKSPD